MADFCKQCSIEIFDEDFGDLADLTEGDLTVYVQVLCEGCGTHCWVDSTGKCVSHRCLKKHGLQNAE
jgi:hypothetical protein